MPPLFFKLLPYGVALIALLGAIWYIDHQGYKRAEKDNQLEQARADTERANMKNYIDLRTKSVEKNLGEIITRGDDDLHRSIGQIDMVERTVVQPTLVREIKSDPRFSDPNLGITDGMLNAINKARSASRSSCASTPDGGVTCELPAPEPVN